MSDNPHPTPTTTTDEVAVADQNVAPELVTPGEAAVAQSEESAVMTPEIVPPDLQPAAIVEMPSGTPVLSNARPAGDHPRSPRRRMQAQQQGTARGIRSQPLAAASPPARQEQMQLPEPVLPHGPWRWRWPLAVLALVAWVGALLLLTTNLSAALPALGSPRRVFVLGWGLASVLTFAPVQWRLALSGLTWQGVFGWTLASFLLAWAPPPSGNLLSLPELPGYLLLFLAVFYAATAAVTPIAFTAGQRLFSQRIHRLDARRARRQGYEAGLLTVAVMALANMSVLVWWTGLLLVIVIVLLETLFLSQVRPEG